MIFHLLDKDSNLEISGGELFQVMNDREVGAMVNRLDKNKDEAVQLNEFTSKWNKIVPKIRWERVFSLLIKDESKGVLSGKEIPECIKEEAKKKSKKDEINLAEFKAIMENLVKNDK